MIDILRTLIICVSLHPISNQQKIDMQKNLVIVESPAKAKTIEKFLGKDYKVMSSYGHIRDLKTKDFSIDLEHNYAPEYVIPSDKKKLVTELKNEAKKAEQVWLASDEDREGEAISWHLYEVLGLKPENTKRIVFHEITKNAILHAIETPRDINIDLVNAQQARRILDRIVGFELSPILWRKVKPALSAGRVQSVAVRLIVEREREINEFVSEAAYRVIASFILPDGTTILKAELNRRLKDKEEVEAFLESCKDASFTIDDISKKPVRKTPAPPFTTSTLQQEAARKLGYSVSQTMMIAQRLYESGLITYMRTDSVNLSDLALGTAKEAILDTYGEKYYKFRQYHTKSKGAQEAHEAIRPTYISNDEISGTAQEKRLYELIRKRTIACQMADAELERTTISVGIGGKKEKFVATGEVITFDGFLQVYRESFDDENEKEQENGLLPPVTLNEVLSMKDIVATERFTQRPPRYTEASLVRRLEELGIGRPSTYASIISTIQDRGYVRVENRRFYAEKMGEIVTDRLEENFRELMNYDFTAQMENSLDQVANHEAEWKAVLDHFFSDFTQQLDKAEKDPEEGGMRPNQMVLTSIDCPTCGRKMGIRTASTGVFLGCSGYALPPKERCKTTINLVPENEVLNVLEGEDAETNALRAKRRCPKCGTAMDSYLIDPKRKLHVCGNNPTCDGYEIEEGEFRIKGYDGPIVECEKCGSEMHLKMGRFGKYMACTNEECKNTRKILRNGEVAPPKEDPVPLPELPCEKSDAYFVLRDGAAGVFLAANTFPKSRETRAPLVEELYRFRDRLPEKLRYLADAPQQDPEGNKTMVRFSRKTKQQYVSSEKDGKATGWSAFYVDGKWVEGKK